LHTEEILEQITAEGMDALPEMFQILINKAMRLEREQHLGVGPYEQTPERHGHANEYYEAWPKAQPKTVKTRVGEIQFEVL